VWIGVGGDPVSLGVEPGTELVEATDELQGSDDKNKPLLVGYFADRRQDVVWTIRLRQDAQRSHGNAWVLEQAHAGVAPWTQRARE
jgi:hypothetical protein